MRPTYLKRITQKIIRRKTYRERFQETAEIGSFQIDDLEVQRPLSTHLGYIEAVDANVIY